MSALFRGNIPFHTYSAQPPRKILEEIGEYGASRNAGAHAKQDVPHIFAEALGKTKICW
jgi:hypothetical protein